MMDIHLQFEDESGTVLWSEMISAPMTFTVGETVRLRSTIAPGCEDLWQTDIPRSRDFVVQQVEHVFDRRYGATVASVKSLQFLIVHLVAVNRNEA
jgi:hypothetical protein